MTESFERIVTPEMERLIAEGNWTAVEILEEAEIAARATVPEPRQEVSEETVADVVPIVTEPAETADEHSCPLDIVDIRAREAAIRAGKLKQADGIDADTLERHASCIRGDGPGRIACANMLAILDADTDQDDESGRDDIYELFG